MILVITLFSCTKEYSCEDCREVVVDSIIVDTPPSNMISYYDIFIDKNSDVRRIYVEYTSKYHPRTYLIFDSIPLETTISSRYIGRYDLMDWLPVNEVYNRGDTFLFRYEVRWRFKPATYPQEDILIY